MAAYKVPVSGNAFVDADSPEAAVEYVQKYLVETNQAIADRVLTLPLVTSVFFQTVIRPVRDALDLGRIEDVTEHIKRERAPYDYRWSVRILKQKPTGSGAS